MVAPRTVVLSSDTFINWYSDSTYHPILSSKEDLNKEIETVEEARDNPSGDGEDHGGRAREGQEKQGGTEEKNRKEKGAAVRKY